MGGTRGTGTAALTVCTNGQCATAKEQEGWDVPQIQIPKIQYRQKGITLAVAVEEVGRQLRLDTVLCVVGALTVIDGACCTLRSNVDRRSSQTNDATGYFEEGGLETIYILAGSWI